jgi:transcriptional regulator with XRE-family HTH domain
MKQPELGKKILELRLAKRLTQTELAEKCNISLRTIQRIESNDVVPRSYSVKTIFSVLDYNSASIISNFNLNEKSVDGFEFRLKKILKYIKDLFNLKKNTMKKISFLSTIILIIIFLTKSESNAQAINGWSKVGSKPNSYEVGFDKDNAKTGKKSAYIASIENDIKGFGTLMQSCDAKNYLGKKIKLTAFIRSENVSNRAGMWLRVDSKFAKKHLSFDNMKDRPIKGDTDWIKYEIVLNVPLESSTLNYGVLINGTGKVWFDQLSIEIVGNMDADYKSTSLPDKPTNIDFEE